VKDVVVNLSFVTVLHDTCDRSLRQSKLRYVSAAMSPWLKRLDLCLRRKSTMLHYGSTGMLTAFRWVIGLSTNDTF